MSGDFARGAILTWRRRWRRVVNDHDLLRLLGGEKQGNEPTDERNPEENVDDDNCGLVGAVFLDGCDGGQEIDV